MNYFVYVLRCADSSLYVGSTSDLEKRLHQHNNLKSGAHYTKIRRPVEMVYSEKLDTYADARRREGEIKRLKRAEKLELIDSKGKNSNFNLLKNCKLILAAYKKGKLGQTIMPEDSHPQFSKKQKEMRLAYFTLPMALNYQRDSYKLWEAALKTFNDPETNFVFDVAQVSAASEGKARKALMKYKLALQPNKHIATWMTIAKTIHANWGSFENFFKEAKNDFLTVKNLLEIKHKKGFPYLSGPKIFNYWSFIISTYGGIKLKNRDHIEIAPDTHITQCSVKLGVITKSEAEKLSKDTVSVRWRELLKGSGIDPIDMHSPLWFWSRNGFVYKIT